MPLRNDLAAQGAAQRVLLIDRRFAAWEITAGPDRIDRLLDANVTVLAPLEEVGRLPKRNHDFPTAVTA